MRRIYIPNGMDAKGIGVIFIFLFLWFFFYILISYKREKKLQKKRLEIREMIEDGIRKKKIRSRVEVLQSKTSEVEEAKEWEKEVKKKAQKDIGLFQSR